MSSANDPGLRSWIPVSEDSHFPIQNLPFGVFSVGGEQPRVGVAIGEFVLDLCALFESGKLRVQGLEENVFAASSLNPFIACGRSVWTDVRNTLSNLLREGSGELRDDASLRDRVLISRTDVRLHLPIEIADYVDFYSSEYHATNVGRMFRPDNPLMPNWKHLPVGYNGRSSSVVVSGTPIRRPMGQTKADDAAAPSYGPSRLLDFELEVGFYVGVETALGSQLDVSRAKSAIFGVCLVNDWSARDIQKWEYQPLGPFLSKSFGTSVSPWVVMLEALEPFRCEGPVQDPAVLPYLSQSEPRGVDMNLEVWLKSASMTQPQKIAATNFKHMYWSMAQQLAHQTVNGTNLRIGDLYASGTVSGPTEFERGCMLELTWRGEQPIRLAETGEERKFLADGDEVTMTGWCQGQGYRVGFGEVTGQILPAIG